MVEKNQKIYPEQEVIAATLEYFKGDALATDVWIKKYCLKDEENLYERTPDDMHWRIANELARIEAKYPNPLKADVIYETLKGFHRIIPGGSPMSGIGNNYQVTSIGNCFVVGSKHDSYGSIFKIDQEQVQLMKRRGGVGHDLSAIRPNSTPVKNDALRSTGVVPFMDRYSNSTKEVAQSGRRGALMLSISIKHPDSEAFIDAKMEEGRITGANVSVKISDEFMKAVENGSDFIQAYPITVDISNEPNLVISEMTYNEIYNGTFGQYRKIKARELWKKIIFNAWKSAEPGILFWDTIARESIPACYGEEWKETSTNPCVVGDTKIALADGRIGVTIKDLAEIGNDVPVYCLDKKGKLAIRTMRNPRITGKKQQIYKVVIENGHVMRVTGNHKFRLKSGEYKQAKDLKLGDSLNILTKYEASFDEIFEESNSRSSNYYWLNDGSRTNKSEHRFIYESLTKTKIQKGFVIHHKDFNSLNNSKSNLQLLTKVDHDNYHGGCIMGDNNPYHSMSEERKFNFASHKGESNPRYIDVSNEEIMNHAIILTKKLNKRFTKKEWIKYAKKNNLPHGFTEYRQVGFNSIATLAKLVALELNIDNDLIDHDPRLIKSYKAALDNGYNARIKSGLVIVEKTCENCGEPFWVDYQKREISFCSHSCGLNYVNTDDTISKSRTASLNETYKNKSAATKLNQLKIYKDLEFELNRTPLLSEWEIACTENNIQHRLKTKYGFSSFKDLKRESEYYNHKVIEVTLDGLEDVYNGTVDEFHNFFSGEFSEKTKSNKAKFLYVNQLQCGELPLPPYDSCRLLALNLYSYVNNPFTPEAKFNFELFKADAEKAMRYMDDIVDLEVEKIERILAKINSDPEDDFTKMYEIKLWENIIRMTKLGRRTGLGITAEGDMLAALGLRYGSEEGNDFAELVHMEFKLSAYHSSVTMAEERGAFPIYNAETEDNNPFISRIKEEDPSLYARMQEFGRRNIALLTIAPTGSVSICTQTSSGIEPVFNVAYKRRRKINPQEKDVRIDYVDEEGVSWSEYQIFHHKFVTWLEVNGYDPKVIMTMTTAQIDEIIKKSPYYKSMSGDVDWVMKVMMQGRINKHIDHSISATTNLPADISEEMVAKVYETGWKYGCKGMTVYRDGSRSGVLITETEKKEIEMIEAIQDTHAPKRPKRLKGDIFRFQNNLEKWIAVVGVKNGRPYEIFTGKLMNGLSNIPLNVKECEIVKNIIEVDSIDDDGKPMLNDAGEPIKVKKKRYDIEYVDSDGTKQISTGLSHTFNPEYWNYAKLISGILRHGMPLVYVYELIESLNLNDETLNTWKNGVERVIKKYIANGEKTKGKCPECGGEHFEFKEGCLICVECGLSGCS